MSKDELEEAGPKESSGKKKIIILALVAVALVGASVGATVMVMGGKAETKEAGEKKSSKKGKDDTAKEEAAGDHGDGHAKDEHGAADAESHDEDAEDEDEHASEDEEEEGHGDDEEKHAKKAFYFPFAPAFVVNFQSKDKEARSRFLKVELEGVAADEKVGEEVKTHMPMIRNKLLMLFSKQFYEDLLTAEGKEKLRLEALTEIQSAMKKATGKKKVKDVYFTSFVMQ
jgi:flagellar FliL protein